MPNGQQDSDFGITQTSYQETDYQDNNWEVVGELPETQEFVPVGFEVVPTHGQMIDPMFADYGGLSEPQEKRWHLPEGLAFLDPGAPGEENETEDSRLLISPEELEEMKQAAYAQGKEEGLAEAVAENAQRIQGVEAQIVTLLADMKEQIRDELLNIEKKAVDLSLQISRKLVASMVEVNPEYILPLIQESLTHAGTSLVRKIRVSPQDMEFIEVMGLKKHLSTEEDEWQFEADENIRAGCVIETSAGEIDFDLDEAWERIQEKVVRLIK
jgi:flagellar biosynthesis/type III secretory pathway protein FliH